MIAWELFALALCLFVSAFFSASETAMLSLGPLKLEKLLQDMNPWRRPLKLWRDRPLDVQASILIGNNVVNITASTLGADVTDKLLGNTPYAGIAIPVAVGVMTFLTLTFGEITPKAFAQVHHEKLAVPVMWLLQGPFYVLYLPTIFFARISKTSIRLSGAHPDDAQNAKVTEEDIELLVEMSRRHGALGTDKDKLLQSVFDYTETTVRESMVPRVDMVAVEADWPLDKIIITLMRSGHSRVPVYDDVIDKIIGVFYAKDILKAVHEDRLASFQMRDFLRPVTFVPEQMRISDLLRQFQKSRIHIAVVVDEFGGTSGLITLEDVIEVFFGDIQDEYDVEEDYFQEIEPGVLRASAKTPVSLITEHFNVEIPEEEEGDYDSLGGFVVAQLGSLPPVGTELIYEGLRFQVTKADARRVIEVLVCRCAPNHTLPGDKTEADRAAS